MKIWMWGVRRTDPWLVGLVRVVGEKMRANYMNQYLPLKEGDSITLGFKVVDDNDPPNTINLSGKEFRFCVRTRNKVVDHGAYPDEIIFMNSIIDTMVNGGASGEVTLAIESDDTKGVQWQHCVWEMEMLALEAPQAGTGTVDVVEGSGQVIGHGTAWASQLKPGDAVQVNGAFWTTVRNVKSNTELETDVGRWTTLSGKSWNYREGQVTTIAGGICEIMAEVVV
jgi:hypothetical protein